MAWIESHQSLGTHRKTKALQRLLKINTVKAVGHLHLLWWWCLDNAPDGDLSRLDPEDLAEAAMWTGNPNTFVNSLVVSGFCEENPLKLHDWDDYTGKLIQRRTANRERMRSTRATHVQDTNIARAPATVPNTTVPNTTVPKDITEIHISVESLRLSNLLRELMLTNDPGAKSPDDLKKWAIDIDRINRLDKRSFEDIEAVIRHSQQDKFWKTNILSAGKLREKFGTIYLQQKNYLKQKDEKQNKSNVEENDGGNRNVRIYRGNSQTGTSGFADKTARIKQSLIDSQYEPPV